MLRVRQLRALQQAVGRHLQCTASALGPTSSSYTLNAAYNNCNPSIYLGGFRRMFSTGPSVPVETAHEVDVTTPASSEWFDQALDEVAAMRLDSVRLEKLCDVISRCHKNEEWVNLLRLGLFLLSSPYNFCHHSCMLVAAALSTSPYPAEALSYMQELAARSIEPHPSCIANALHDLNKKEDHEALAKAILGLSQHGVMLFPDNIEYAFSLCLRMGNKEAADKLLQVLESTAGYLYIRSAYFSLSKLDPNKACQRHQQMADVGIYKHAAVAKYLVANGEAEKAVPLLEDALLLDRIIEPTSIAASASAFKDVAVELLKDTSNQFIGHREKNDLEDFMWMLLRRFPTGSPAYENMMVLWGTVGDDLMQGKAVGAGAESDPESVALREACGRRRLEVLYDMMQSGVTPQLSSFKCALNLSPALSDNETFEEIRKMNQNGAFKSLAGLWAAIMVTSSAANLPTALISQLMQDNVESALNDTQLLLNRFGERPLRRALMLGGNGQQLLDAAGMEKYLYNVEELRDIILQYAWVQILGQYIVMGNVRKNLPADDDIVAQLFDMKSRPLLFWVNIKKRSHVSSKSEAAVDTRPPYWFIMSSTRTNKNPMLLSESFRFILNYYASVDATPSFEEIAEHVFDHSYYNLSSLLAIREQCKKKKKMEKFHSIMLELAAGMSNGNPLGARLLSSFKANNQFFDTSGLKQHWREALLVRGPHVMLDGLFRETVSYYVSLIKPPVPPAGGGGKSKDSGRVVNWTPLGKVSEVLDNIATIAIAQMTTGLTCCWKDLNNLIPAAFAYNSNKEFSVHYKRKILNLGKLILVSDHFDSLVPARSLLTHLSRIGYTVGLEQLWDSGKIQRGARSEHVLDILRIKDGRSNTDIVSKKWVTNMFEEVLFNRGVNFAVQMLQQSGALDIYLRSYVVVICSAEARAADPDAVRKEMERFGRIVERISKLRFATDISTLDIMRRAFGSNSDPVAVSSLLLFIETLVEDMEKLPPHSISIQAAGGRSAEQVAGVLASATNYKRRIPVRPADNAHVIESVYPPRHRDITQRLELSNSLLDAISKMAWMVSPADQELYIRFITCQTRINALSGR